MKAIISIIPGLSGISDVLWTAIIIAFSTTMSPLILSYFTNRHAHRDRVEDWARQDAVAQKAEDAAKLLIESNRKMAAKTDETAALLLADNKKVAVSTATTIEKLDVIHTLVNSNMTAAMQDGLVAVKAQLVLLNEIMEMNRAAGRKPSVDTLATIKATEAKVAELSATLRERLEVQKIPAVAAEQAKAKAKGQE